MAKKQELLKLADTLRSNYIAYQKDKSHITHLKAGIEAFEKTIPDLSKLDHLLSSVALTDLPACLDALLWAAKSYVALALENKADLNKHHQLLEHALDCYELTSNLVKQIQPVRMTTALSLIELEADFSGLKIAYLKAAGEFDALKKQMQSDNQPDSGIQARLQKIQQEISGFNQKLKKGYKNPFYRKSLNITAEFEDEVNQILNSINDLLKAPSKRKNEEITEPSTQASVFKTPVSIPKKKKSQTEQVMPDQEAAVALLSLSLFCKQQPEQEKPGNTAKTLQLS
ncbi:hypothetical protein DIZ81_02075 [Legionella taurinensis]|uniref:Uncharacterized protein n=1 Tax=Legionella taurinensis TaxID=70611 RepID=A0A3A5L2X4_9GAMM|nr:hypothetical protein [Legionella taurinensis]MDX1836342.1 hypothetical protein [Legionella taurinensis]PUT41908.1 hypothetical protein DB744_02080 [Legionella taurinensis]PUT44697.1 hypothetical protein DB746_02080 [Legionella taurinensis]PUT48017.1 hypothetical protein DB743_00240 [Legionella taurinensis]PUT48830.1 hypothetical protein DB745_02080 [Legionella taurinensis]